MNMFNWARETSKRLSTTTVKSRISLFALFVSILLYSSIGATTNSSKISVIPGEYMVKAQIIMPHLEESLRYATTNSLQCLSNEDASSLFPVLTHASFANCTLKGKQPEGEYVQFDLICLNSEAASGLARFVVDEEVFRATLNVKMGGKNMKFSQRINGHRTGDCKTAQ